MSNISLLLNSGVANATDSRNQAQSAVLRERQLAAYQAVSQENRLAAVDTSELSSNTETSGKFQFDFNSSSSSSSTSISWAGSFSSAVSDGNYTTNFSFNFSISHAQQVALGDGVTADGQQLSGQDFSLDRNGILTLAQELAKQLNSEDDTQADLGGQLTSKLQDLLEKLGLIDGDGKATPALQLMSDYANLNRFQAGQQVTAQTGFQYSATYSARSLSWQGWSQQQQQQAAETASPVINIDDQDVVNVNVITGDNNTVENKTGQ
jgi:hypothetical protein